MEELKKHYRLICDVMAKKPVRTDMVLWQGDSAAYRMEFVFRCGGEAFVAPEGTTAAVRFLRCDGTTVCKQAQISGDTVVYEPDLHDTACPGECMGTVELYHGDTRLTSWAFWFEVAQAVGDGVIVPTDDEVSLVTQLVREITGVGDYAKEQAEYAREQGDYAVSCMGDTQDLITTDKETLVGAINEVKTDFAGLQQLPQRVEDAENCMGDTQDLITADKENLVGAINEVKTEFDGMGFSAITLEDGESIDLLLEEGLYYVRETLDGTIWNYHLAVAKMESGNLRYFLQVKLLESPASKCKDVKQEPKIMFRWGYWINLIQDVPNNPQGPTPLGGFSWKPWQYLVGSEEFEKVADIQKWDKRVIKAEEFSGYTKLAEADFPYTTEVGNNAFANCTKLETANLPKATTVNGYAFYNCTALHTVDLPQATYLGQDTFANCHKLETVSIPLATAISKQVFYHCYALKILELPNVTRIEKNAFRSCTALSTLVLGGSAVCSLADAEVFHETPIEKGAGKIYVPDELVEDYKAAETWTEFARAIRPVSELS